MKKLFPTALLFVAVAACGQAPPSAEQTAQTDQAIYATPRSGFVNTQTADPMTGRYLCVAYTPGLSPAVSWRDCDLTDPNQDWGIYSFNVPAGALGQWQWAYLKSTGNPATSPHTTLCIVASASSNPPVLDAQPCDSTPPPGTCNGSCAGPGYCYPGTNCPSNAAALVQDFQFAASTQYCPDVTVLTQGGAGVPFGAIPATTQACSTSTTRGGVVPYGFVTVLGTDDSSGGTPYYVQWSGGLRGVPAQAFEGLAGQTVLDHRHQAANNNQFWTILLDPTAAFGQGVHLTYGTTPSAGCTSGQCAGTYQGRGFPSFGTNNVGDHWVVNASRQAFVGGVLQDSSGDCVGLGPFPGQGQQLSYRSCANPGGSIHLGVVIK